MSLPVATRDDTPQPAPSFATLTEWQQRNLNQIIKKLTIWRNEDHDDTTVLWRSDVCTILDAIASLSPAPSPVRADSDLSYISQLIAENNELQSQLEDRPSASADAVRLRKACELAFKFIESEMRYSQPAHDMGEEPSDQFTYNAVPVVMELRSALALSPQAEGGKSYDGSTPQSQPVASDQHVAANTANGPSEATPAPADATIPGSDDMEARFDWLQSKAIDMGYMLVPEPEHPDSPHAHPAKAVGVEARSAVIRLLWEKQFEKSPWADKFHLIRLDSLQSDYGALADKIIAAIASLSPAPSPVRADINAGVIINPIDSAGMRGAMKQAMDDHNSMVPQPHFTLEHFPAGLHPRTADLVKRFAVALAKKLRLAEMKYGWEDGWSRDDWEVDCRDHLYQHLDKGDPRDVAAYCAFMWHHGWITHRPSASVDAVRLREALLPIISALDRATGDTDAPAETDEEYHDQYPAHWAMQRLCALRDDLSPQADGGSERAGETTKSEGGVESRHPARAEGLAALPVSDEAGNPDGGLAAVAGSRSAAGVAPGPSDTNPRAEAGVDMLTLADELDGWHDCADGDVSAGGGHFRLQCISDSDPQRLNLRATLRAAATALRTKQGGQPADWREVEKAQFNDWYDRNFKDPDGSDKHNPDWLKDDLWSAWQASRDGGR